MRSIIYSEISSAIRMLFTTNVYHPPFLPSHFSGTSGTKTSSPAFKPVNFKVSSYCTSPHLTSLCVPRNNELSSAKALKLIRPLNAPEPKILTFQANCHRHCFLMLISSFAGSTTVLSCLSDTHTSLKTFWDIFHFISKLGHLAL